MTRVRDLMSPDIHVVAETDPLTATARLMRAHDVGSLPVCGQDGRLRGVLTDRDIVVGAVADDA
ncbi:MAG: CBS domain-containing protein, partial [Salana multivorans]|nr:CBS domain-containing protein [Salana multivorans]